MSRNFSNLVDPDDKLAVEAKQDDAIAELQKLNSGGTKYATQIDEVGSVTYVGKAAIGSATSASVWQIMKIDESGDPELVITWADGNDNFDNVWDNRLSLTYT